MSTEDETDEEQVVGVLRPCEVCEAKTVHIDGVCRDHQVVRRRKIAPAARVSSAAATSGAPAAPAVRRVKKRPPPPPPTHRLRNAIVVLLLVGGVVGAGFIHIVRGSDMSTHICAKDGWSLSDTYVNFDDFRAGLGATSLKVATALRQCELY